jgi:hypothetical protein
MKTVGQNFEVAINAPVQRPQFVVKIYMGLDNTDPIYFTSHKNTPVPSGVTVYRNVLRAVSGKSQKLNVLKANAEIGSLKFEILDKNNTITDLFNSKFFDAVLEKAMRHREVELYVGYGYDNADYELLFTQRIDGNLGYDGGKYSITCYDIQREQRKKLFQMKETRLTSTIKSDVSGVDISFNATGNQINSVTTDLSGHVAGEYVRFVGSAGNSLVSPSVPKFFEVVTSTANQITTVEAIVTESAGPPITVSPATINVLDTSEFLAVDHGTSYTDETSGTKVGYVKIEDETFSWEHGNTTATRFDKVRRGALGSRPAYHEVDAGITEEEQYPLCSEVMHLELPSLKMAYALQTGVLHNQSGETIPDHWSSLIPTSRVNLSEYTQYADEGLWDAADDTKGQILRLIETKEIEGKKYIEERIMRAAGCFNIVRATGSLGLIKSTGVIHDAATVATLDDTNVSKVSNFRYDQKDVYNLFQLTWNYIDSKSTRKPIVFDLSSQNKYDKSLSMTIPLYGIYGGRHTKNTIANIFDTLRDRYAGSPLKCSVSCHTSLGLLEVGDIVQLKIDHIPDHTSVGKTLNRAVEIQRINVDFTKGVTVDVFGSTERSQSILQYTDGTAAGSAFITSEGTDMQTYLESTYGVDGVTDVSVPGILKIKANCTIPGNASMASGIYYYDGAMQINSGVTVTVTENWQWRFTDLFTNNGHIDGRGNGKVGGTVGGYLGATRGQRHSRIVVKGESIFNTLWIEPLQSADDNIGIHSAAPSLDLVFDGTSLSGIPDDIRPVAGLSGGDMTTYPSGIFSYIEAGTWSGGAGGDGGSSGVIISDGATGSFGSSINLGGDFGSDGAGAPSMTCADFQAGRGAPGYGGCLYMIKLNPSSSITGIRDSFTSINGSFAQSNAKRFGAKRQNTCQLISVTYGDASGNATASTDSPDSNYVEQFFPTYIPPVEDLPEADQHLTATMTDGDYIQTSSTTGDATLGAGIKLTRRSLKGYTDNGTVTFNVDTTTGNFTTGAATDYLNGVGVFLGYSGSAYKFSVGDPSAEKYLAFDGADVVVGRDTELAGADAYNNKAIYVRTNLRSGETSDLVSTGGSITHGNDAITKIVTTTTVLSSALMIHHGPSYGLTDYTLSSDRRFRTVIYFQSLSLSSGRTTYLVTGSGAVGASGFGFHIDTANVIKGIVKVSGTEYFSSSFGTVTNAVSYKLEAVKTFDRVKFYINGAYKGEVVQVPSGTTFANQHLYLRSLTVNNPGVGAYELRISEFKMLQ